MRGRSYSPSPPRGYSRRGRSPSPRGRYGGRSRDLPTSLLVRNLRHDCRFAFLSQLIFTCAQETAGVMEELFCLLAERNSTQVNDATGDIHVAESGNLSKTKLIMMQPEDLRRPFEQFGALKDIYLPRDYYTGEPRGFGFVQYADPHDAAEAKHHMDGRVFLGRELTVVFAEENRKKPVDMRARERTATRGRVGDRRRSPPRYSRSPRHSRSPPPRHATSRSHSRDYYSPPKRRHHSRFAFITFWFLFFSCRNPIFVSYGGTCMPFASKANALAVPNCLSVSPRERRYSQERSYSRSRSHSQTPNRGQIQSPARSRSRSPRRSRSRSPIHDEYPKEVNGDKSPSP
ncbi:hypothetical protein POTOM_012924 [Populus tomentosa]|uniref:RRM domain-containing protein n=1 Tax=Populus tomentosa TaxID=118781 RepID=A0A8X8AM06_POPTO|nr:hypothetical protein POTOM_012924 [Populus tomentosa]